MTNSRRVLAECFEACDMLNADFQLLEKLR
jgi:hypothetical protein